MNVNNNPLLGQRPNIPGVGSDLAAGWREFDLLAAVVSRYQASAEHMKLVPMQPPQEHRISCHRCGNIRKRRTLCSRPNCPHTFCGRCTDKLKLEYGNEIFSNGCPVCKDLCCCSNKTVTCERKNHCYRKCPATKQLSKPSSSGSPSVKEEEDAKDGAEAATEANFENEVVDKCNSAAAANQADLERCQPCSTEEKQPKKKQRVSHQSINKIPDIKPLMPSSGLHYPFMFPYADPTMSAPRGSVKRAMPDDLERYMAARNYGVDPMMMPELQGFNPYGYPFPPYPMMPGYGRHPSDRAGLMYPSPYSGLDEDMLMAMQRNFLANNASQGLSPQLQYMYARNALASDMLARQAAAGMAQDAAVPSSSSGHNAPAKSTAPQSQPPAPAATTTAAAAAPPLPLGMDKAMLERLAADKDNAMSLLAMVSSYNLALEQEKSTVDI